MPEIDIDALVQRAVWAVSAIARRGSTLTTSVAMIAAFVVGGAYVVGLAAFGGGTRSVWAIVGGAMLIIAVGAPLVATFRLLAIPRKATSLVGELRTLLRRDESARRVVIDTVEAEPGAPSPALGGTRTPEVVLQFQRFSSLGAFATSDDVKHIASVARTIGSLPALVATGILLIGLGAVLGFFFTLVWIF